MVKAIFLAKIKKHPFHRRHGSPLGGGHLLEVKVQHQIPVDFCEPQGNGIVAQKTPLTIHIKKIVQHRLEEGILVGGGVHLCRGQGHVHNADDPAFGEGTEGDGALLQVPAGGAHGDSIAWMGIGWEMGWCFCFFCEKKHFWCSIHWDSGCSIMEGVENKKEAVASLFH